MNCHRIGRESKLIRNTNIDRLIAISSNSICEEQSCCLDTVADFSIRSQLLQLLCRRNGFATFESALVVFPGCDSKGVLGLSNWNFKLGWRRFYHGVISPNSICFAHDVFGGQFVISETGISKLDPESGEVTHYAASIDKWAQRLLNNYSEDTGWVLAHEWQVHYRPLLIAERLIPRQPFILGGDYSVSNLIAVNSVTAMEKWGRLYSAIRDIPDGTKATVYGWVETTD